MAKKILVVDDEFNVVKLLELILKDKGYEVIVAADGSEALEKTYKEKPDLIILDVMLPKIDGYEVCSKLRADENFKDLPVVLLTGLGMDIKKGMELGAVSYIGKPFNVEVLLKIVKTAVG